MGDRLPRELPAHSVLSQLAREDPCAYETLRRELIEDFLSNTPESVVGRLRGLQFRIDCVRRLSHSALGSTLKVYGMMHESFLQLNVLLNDIHEAGPETDTTPAESAQVIEFRKLRRP